LWDIPGVCHYLDKEFVDFFDALSQTENFNYFALEPVKKLIDLNYPLVKKYSVYKLLIPFVFFMMVYFYYFFVCIENERIDPENWTLTTDIVSVIVVLFASYFFKNEVTELYHEGLNYFTSFWNYIDIFPALGIYTLFLIRISDKIFNVTNHVDPNNPS
jgi:Polycystin cation channel